MMTNFLTEAARVEAARARVEAARVEAAHGVLAALLHAAVGNDPQATPASFNEANELGLIKNVRLTAAGRAVLMLVGAKS
jgi:hypothetical protein